MTGEDSGLKPSTIEQGKFEYSPLGKIFNKGLSKDDKEEGLLKRLKNLEDKNKVENKVGNKSIIEVTDFVSQPSSFEAKELINEIKTIQKNVNYRKLNIKGGNNTDYDFSDYRTCKELFRDLYYRAVTIDEAESKQEELNVVIVALKNYTPRDNKYVEAKNNLLNNVKNFYEGREKIIEGFKNRVFPLYYNKISEQMEASAAAKDEQEQEEKQKPTKDDLITLNKHITDEEKNINEELFKKHFNFQRLSDMLMFLNKTNDKEKNNELVNVINSRLKDFIKFNKEISEEERMTEKTDKITKVVKKILKFNRRIQKGQSIKILTPNQMLSRLPITLA